MPERDEALKKGAVETDSPKQHSQTLWSFSVAFVQPL